MTVEADFIRQQVPTPLMKRCFAWANEVVKKLADMPEVVANQVEGREIDKDPVAQARAKAAEVAVALSCGLDPIKDVYWRTDKPDAGCDVMTKLGCRIEVKETEFSGVDTAVLIWPVSKNDQFAGKDFHVLMLVRCEVRDGKSTGWFELRGWIDKGRFYREKLVAGRGLFLDPNTWHVPLGTLTPVRDYFTVGGP